MPGEFAAFDGSQKLPFLPSHTVGVGSSIHLEKPAIDPSLEKKVDTLINTTEQSHFTRLMAGEVSGATLGCIILAVACPHWGLAAGTAMYVFTGATSASLGLGAAYCSIDEPTTKDKITYLAFSLLNGAVAGGAAGYNHAAGQAALETARNANTWGIDLAAAIHPVNGANTMQAFVTATEKGAELGAASGLTLGSLVVGGKALAKWIKSSLTEQCGSQEEEIDEEPPA